MCNLYSVTKGQQAIRDLYRVMVDRTGNMPSLPGIPAPKTLRVAGLMHLNLHNKW